MPSRTFQNKTVTVRNCFQPNPGVPASCIKQTEIAQTGNVVEDSRPVRPHPLSNTYMTISRTFHNVSTTRRGAYFGSVNWCWSGVGTTSVTTDTTAQVAALRSRAASNLISGDLNAAESMAELRESTRTVTQLLSSLTNVVEKVALGDIPGVEEAINQRLTRRERRIMNQSRSVRLASTILTVQYGIRPILSDIYGAIDEYRKKLQTTGDRVSASSGFKPPRHFPSPVLGDPSHLPPLAAHGSASGTVTDPTLRKLEQLGLLNPALLAWNLLPFSFVVDWALDISGCLTTLLGGCSLIGMTTSATVERRIVLTYIGGPWTRVDQVVYRTNGTVPGGPAINVSLYAAPSVERIVTALALLRLASR